MGVGWFFRVFEGNVVSIVCWSFFFMGFGINSFFSLLWRRSWVNGEELELVEGVFRG